RERSSFFLDTAHLNNFTAQLIGRAISRTVGQLKSQKLFENITTARQLTREFKVVDVATLDTFANDAGYVNRHVSNSLITQDFIGLRIDQRLEFEIEDDWEVVGYRLNARRCNASLRIEGDITINRRAAFRRYDPSDQSSPFVCARALPYPIRPKDGKVVFSV